MEKTLTTLINCAECGGEGRIPWAHMESVSADESIPIHHRFDKCVPCDGLGHYPSRLQELANAILELERLELFKRLEPYSELTMPDEFDGLHEMMLDFAHAKIVERVDEDIATASQVITKLLAECAK